MEIPRRHRTQAIAPCVPQGGYSRWTGRFIHLCFKAVRAGLPAHGFSGAAVADSERLQLLGEGEGLPGYEAIHLAGQDLHLLDDKQSFMDELAHRALPTVQEALSDTITTRPQPLARWPVRAAPWPQGSGASRHGSLLRQGDRNLVQVHSVVEDQLVESLVPQSRLRRGVSHRLGVRPGTVETGEVTGPEEVP
jgi:hypothetical protein